MNSLLYSVKKEVFTDKAASSVLQCRMESLFLCPYAGKTGIMEEK